eukprot:9757947-Alexandrium_andersonii.AAC.1
MMEIEPHLPRPRTSFAMSRAFSFRPRTLAAHFMPSLHGRARHMQHVSAGTCGRHNDRGLPSSLALQHAATALADVARGRA